MSPTHIAATILLIALQFALPKRWAFLPLLLAAMHTSYAQVIPSFSTARILIVLGIARATIAGDLRWSSKNPLDILFPVWGVVLVFSAVAHEPTFSEPTPLIMRLRTLVDILGTFLYAKAFLRDTADYKRLAKASCISLIPLSIALAYTKLTGGFNLYSLVGGASYTIVRDGAIRATGPFATPILAGTVGALFIPLIATIWKQNPIIAKIGAIACITIIFSTGSSTPIGALIFAMTALYLWKWRLRMKTIIVVSVVGLIVVDMITTRPIWYLIAITDFVGGSTGWHRSYLIDQAFNHLNEWWLLGTNYTRHWMPYGLPQKPDHADMTNYYIHMGVIGGLPLMLLLVLMIKRAFGLLSKQIKALREAGSADEFTIWTMGALLFTHCLTCLTISYFDQTYVFFFFLLAMISNLHDKKPVADTATIQVPERQTARV